MNLIDGENEDFDEWLVDYVSGLDDDEACDFFYDYMDADLNIDNVKYTVGIP